MWAIFFHFVAMCGGLTLAGCQVSTCPAFSQDRVNFQPKPEGDTALRGDPTWPNRIGYSISCAIMLGSGWGELGGGKAVAVLERAAVGGW